MNGRGTEGSSDDDHGILKKEQTPSYSYPLLDRAQSILRRINERTIVTVEQKLRELRENAQLLDHDNVDLTIWNKIKEIMDELEDQVSGLQFTVRTFISTSISPPSHESESNQDVCPICEESHEGSHFGDPGPGGIYDDEPNGY